MDETSQAPIATSLRLMKALGLARRGQYRAAQTVLAAVGALPDSAVELHALAALVTGEGDYARALRLWRLLLQREPGHAEARRMIASIELWQSRPPWMRFVPAGITVLLLLLLGLAIALAAGGSGPPARSAPAPDRMGSVVQPAPANPAPRSLPRVTVPDPKKNRSGR